MVLESQFGSQITPIERPRVPVDALANGAANQSHAASSPAAKSEAKHEDEAPFSELEMAELARLNALGIPVPGIEIRVDKHVARVWLEDLEVECAQAVFRDRVRVVVERAAETVAGMWSHEGPRAASASLPATANGSKMAGG